MLQMKQASQWFLQEGELLDIKMEKHITTTAYIVAKIAGKLKILLHKHKKHGIWLGVGGHVEGDENPYEGTLREIMEEIGIDVSILNFTRGLTPSSIVSEMPLPYMIKEEKIPRYKNEPAHYHIDFIYFGTTDTPNKVYMDEEFDWFSQDEIDKLNLEKDVKFVVSAAFKNYFERSSKHEKI